MGKPTPAYPTPMHIFVDVISNFIQNNHSSKNHHSPPFQVHHDTYYEHVHTHGKYFLPNLSLISTVEWKSLKKISFSLRFIFFFFFCVWRRRCGGGNRRHRKANLSTSTKNAYVDQNCVYVYSSFLKWFPHARNVSVDSFFL